MIYLITCAKTNTCKIGYAGNPENRLMQLQTGNPFALELAAVITGDVQEEKKIHKLFENYKLKGEWFQYNDSIKEYFNVEEFFIGYSALIDVFMNMNQSEIRVFSFLLQYADGTKFAVDKSIRIEIANVTDLSERTVYNTIKVLESKHLIFKMPSGAYQINPRYAFKGSTSERNQALQTVLELHCKHC